MDFRDFPPAGALELKEGPHSYYHGLLQADSLRQRATRYARGQPAGLLRRG